MVKSFMPVIQAFWTACCSSPGFLCALAQVTYKMVCPACPWALNESPMCQFGSPELHCALCPHETPAPHHGKQSWALATTVQKDPFRYIPKIRYDHCRSEFHKYFKPIKTAVLLFLCPMAILSSHSFPSHAPAIAC